MSQTHPRSRSGRGPRIAGAVLAVLILAGPGCSSTTSPGATDSTGTTVRAANGTVAAGTKLTIATTVAPITSIVAAVVGDKATITGIVPEGTNSHTFEPRPSDAEKLAAADIVFVNGLGLEDPTMEMAQANPRAGSEIVELGTDALPRSEWIFDFSFPEDEGKPNPHLWTDPIYVKAYAEHVRDVLTARDPGNATTYAANTTAFGAVVDRLDAAMRAAFATMAPESRKLLTYHDAYAYFARHYGWTVIGAIQPSDFEEPSPREVADLIDQVKAEEVKAVFGSEVFPSPVLERIGTEAGVRYVDVLRDDDLPGAPGDADHSLLELLRFDYSTMVESLGGDASALRSVDLQVAVPDSADYPQ